MATNPHGASALQTAIQGGKVTDRQAQTALGKAVDKIAGLTRRAKENKEVMVETGTMVLHTAETQGSLFLASMAEGYLGPDKLKVGTVDLRAPIGLLAQGYGIYETMSGRKGGGHALALGNGVLGSWLASVAVNAGRLLAEKRAPAPPLTVVPTVQGQRALPGLLPDPGVAGPVREVLLTPADDDAYVEGRRRRGRVRRRLAPAARRAARFVRAELDEDDNEDLADEPSED